MPIESNFTAEDRTGSKSLIPRPRVEQLIAQALNEPVTTVVAGAGCGKTFAVYSHLMASEARTFWVQLTEADNVPSRFWETFCNAIAYFSAEFSAEALREGFPGTKDGFEHFTERFLDILKPRFQYALVFDDVHLIDNRKVLSFFNRIITTPLSGVAHFLISREAQIFQRAEVVSEMGINTIHEEDLLFTKNEIAEYLKLLGITATPELVADVYESTEGLPHLVNFAGRLLQKNRSGIERIRHTIRNDITLLVEEQFNGELDERMRRLLVKLSLIDHPAADLVSRIESDESLLREIMVRTSLVRYDSYMRVYRLHHVLAEFLADRRDLITEEEQYRVFEVAAAWCSANNYRLEAISYLERMGNYASIINLVYAMQLEIDFHTASYLLRVIEAAPPQAFEDNPYLAVLHSRMLLSAGRLEDAMQNIRCTIAEVLSKPLTPVNADILLQLNINMGFALITQSTESGAYDFVPYFQKAIEYLDMAHRASDPMKLNAALLPYACVVGTAQRGEPERYIEAITHAVPCTVRALGGCLHGADDLTIAEVAYYRGDAVGCERYALQTRHKARESKQFEIEHRALFYLLRLSLYQGKYKKGQEILEQLDLLLQRTETGNRFLLTEIVTSWYYAMIGEREGIAGWLMSDFLQGEPESFVMGLEDIAKCKYYLMEKNYHLLLGFLKSRSESFGISRFLLGKIGLAAHEAVARYYLKDKDGAIAALKRAYDLAEPNSFDMHFIELGNGMRSLANAALKTEKCGIPVAWLETMKSRATTYAKRISQVRQAYWTAHHLGESIRLTERERQLLFDLSQGLSRTEIALYRNLSVNTVKIALQMIYEKLGARGAVDAVRIAVQANLL
jgi:LuxR family maltose regulon positive regulatory protein